MCSSVSSACPQWTVAGVSMQVPECRCSLLYQSANARQNARASCSDPNRSENSGWYFIVLNCASENGLSLLTCDRLCVLATSRSMSSWDTVLEVIAAPRSAWMVNCPGTTRCFSQGAGTRDCRGNPRRLCPTAVGTGHHARTVESVSTGVCRGRSTWLSTLSPASVSRRRMGR